MQVRRAFFMLILLTLMLACRKDTDLVPEKIPINNKIKLKWNAKSVIKKPMFSLISEEN